MDRQRLIFQEPVARVHRKLRHSRTVRRSRGKGRGGGEGICVARPISPSFPTLSFFSLQRRGRGWTRTRGKKSHPRSLQSIPLLGGCPLDTTNRYSRFDMDLGGVQPPAKLSSRPRFPPSLSLSLIFPVTRQIRFHGERCELKTSSIEDKIICDERGIYTIRG